MDVSTSCISVATGVNSSLATELSVALDMLWVGVKSSVVDLVFLKYTNNVTF